MTELRILTVRQPWAWAIMHAGKDVENRPQNIAGDYRGPVVIHAGTEDDVDAFADPSIVAAVALTKILSEKEHWFSNCHELGSILGVVDLVDVHHCDDCWHYCSRWTSEEHGWHLMLADPRPLATPIPWRGRLGLTKIDTPLFPGLEALEGLL